MCAKSWLIARTQSELDWLNPGWMLRAFHFCLISVILLFLLQLKKSICFTFFAHQLFLGQIAWADTLDVSGGKVSHCTVPVCRGVWGLLPCLWGPSAERWLAICVRHYSFVLPSFNRWNVLFIVNVTTHQLVFIYLTPILSCCVLYAAVLSPGHQLPYSVLPCFIFMFWNHPLFSFLQYCSG